MRVRRFLVVTLIVVAILVVGGFFAARYYLHSSAVTHQVTERLEAMYGGPVKVGKVEVGMDGSSLQGFELYEQGESADHSKPWLTVGSIDTDISLWDLIRGQALPRHVTLKQAKVHLRFDAGGHLITQFPRHKGAAADLSKLSQVPEIVLEDSEVVLHKQGQAELVANHVNAKLAHAGDGKIAITGTADSNGLGKLSLNGSVDAKSGAAVVTLKTDRAVPVTQPVLSSVPFVPAVTWQELQVAKGESTAELTVRYNLRDDDLHWRLALAPTKTTARIPVLDLSAHDATGSIVVNDYRIDLKDIAGKAYGGHVKLDGVLDFSTSDYKLSFPKIVLTDLDIAKVPESWNPTELEALRRLAPDGKLSGTASVVVTMPPGKIAPPLVESLLGLTAASSLSDCWLPAVTVLAAFPHREMHTQSTGKATVTGFAGGSAEIELKLGLHTTRPASTPMKSSRRAAPTGEPVARAMGEAESQIIAPLARATGSPATKTLVATVVSFQPPAGPEAYPEINARVGRGVGQLVGGVNNLLDAIINVGNEMVTSVPKKVAPPTPVAPETPTTYLDLNLKLKDVDVAQLVRGLGVKLNTPIQGKLSVQVKVSIPTNRASDMKEYKLKGTAQAQRLQVSGIEIPALDADFAYANGLLNLTSLKGRFAADKGQPPGAGTFTGSGTMQVVPLGPLTADLTLNGVPLSTAAALMPGKERIGGTVSGQLALRGSAEKLKDLTSFDGGGKLTVNRLSAFGMTVEQLTTGVQLKAGVLRFTDLHSTFAGTPITASGELRLSGDYAFKATADLKNWDLAALERAAAKGQEPLVKLAGSFTSTVDVQGTLKPLKFNASGDASAAALNVDKFQVSRARFRWTTDGKTLDLSKLDVQLYGGQATGSAALPLQSTAGGAINLKLTNLDANKLVKDLKVPVKIEGQVGGVVKGTLAPAPAGKTHIGTFDLAVSAPKLRVQNIPTDELKGKLDYKNGIVDYKLEGKTLGGTFELEGQVPSGEPVKKQSGKGKLRINNVSVRGLSEALGLRTAPFSGLLNLDLNFTQESVIEMPEGTGKLRLTDLGWQGKRLAANLSGDLILGNGLLQLRQLTGEVAQGIARVGLTFNLRYPNRSSFFLNLENVEASQLLAPWTGDKIKGTMQASIRGTLGPTWNGHANLELTRGEVYRTEVTQWRLPADWSYSPETGRARVDVHDTSAQVARGRMQGKMSAIYDYGLNVDGNVRAYGVDLQTLIRSLGSSSNIASGTVSGLFTFSGTNVQSIDDLSGNLIASFDQAQALQIPGLTAITPYIGMGPSTTFQNGSLKARLDHGVLRIQSLKLLGGTFKVYADGTVTLAGGLNLNVIAKTGDIGLPTCRLGPLRLRIPIIGPVPVMLLEEATNLLANQVFYLQVTGTVRSPQVRVRVLQMLTEEALRFLLIESNLPIQVAP